MDLRLIEPAFGSSAKPIAFAAYIPSPPMTRGRNYFRMQFPRLWSMWIDEVLAALGESRALHSLKRALRMQRGC